MTRTRRSILRRLAPLLLVLSGAATKVPAAPLDVAQVDGFAADMATKYHFDARSLRNILKLGVRLDSVLAAISKPAEYKPWFRYRTIFLTPERITGGVAYWQAHATSLEAALAQYGVPPEVIVAIIGVETSYGRNAGNYRVLDALGTLAFHYPPRANYFRGELENFLLLARDEQIDPIRLKGSYAGAMGVPQFMPSSFRAYAVDFDHDGRRDIWNSADDVIGSVANYLAQHTWQRGEPIAVPAVPGPANSQQVSATVELNSTVATLSSTGVRPAVTVDDSMPAVLLAFEAGDGDEYWLGFQNFYAITRYNRSPKYALAVTQLASEIREARQRAQP
jgi:membrane-bound lytic murein transglycosylase B